MLASTYSFIAKGPLQQMREWELKSFAQEKQIMREGSLKSWCNGEALSIRSMFVVRTTVSTLSGTWGYTIGHWFFSSSGIECWVYLSSLSLWLPIMYPARWGPEWLCKSRRASDTLVGEKGKKKWPMNVDAHIPYQIQSMDVMSWICTDSLASWVNLIMEFSSLEQVQ